MARHALIDAEVGAYSIFWKKKYDPYLTMGCASLDSLPQTY
jgi:hypothetical protein